MKENQMEFIRKFNCREVLHQSTALVSLANMAEIKAEYYCSFLSIIKGFLLEQFENISYLFMNT